jgi:hypothetical protein
VAARCKALIDLERSNIGIMDSNPTRGMDACPRFAVMCR